MTFIAQKVKRPTNYYESRALLFAKFFANAAALMREKAHESEPSR